MKRAHKSRTTRTEVTTMSKEAEYRQQLTDMGIYHPAFEGEIHALCILERELSRTMKAWKATAGKGQAPDPTDPIYEVIQKQRRDILAHRDALGLTPKALKRLQRQTGQPDAQSPSSGSSAFGRLLDQIVEAASGSAP